MPWRSPTYGPPMTTPVIFIHGLWLHASSWAPWVDLFNDSGYQAIAPGWPGDRDTVAESRAHAEDIGDHGIDDVVEHFAGIVGGRGCAGRRRRSGAG